MSTNEDQTTELVPITDSPPAPPPAVPTQAYVYARTPEQNEREWAAVNANRAKAAEQLAAYRAKIEEQTLADKIIRDGDFTADVLAAFSLFVRRARHGTQSVRIVTNPGALQAALAQTVADYERDLDQIDHNAARALSRRAFQMSGTL